MEGRFVNHNFQRIGFFLKNSRRCGNRLAVVYYLKLGAMTWPIGPQMVRSASEPGSSVLLMTTSLFPR